MLMINSVAKRPVLQQVKTLLKAMIAGQAVPAETEMPTPEQLAVRLAINPNTIRRVYLELEREGYITCSEEGAWFAENGQNQNRVRGRLLEELDSVVEELVLLGVTAQQLTARIKEVTGNDD